MTASWAEDQVEEVDALRAIFDAEAEFELLTPNRLEELRSSFGHGAVGGGTGESLSFSLNISCTTNDGRDTTVRMTVAFPPGYPPAVPGISLMSSSMPRQFTSEIRDDLLKTAESLQGPVVMDLVMRLREIISSKKTPGSISKLHTHVIEGGHSLRCCLLRLDHMHAKQRYCKTIVSWCNELGLTGRLLFQGRLILILVEGLTSDVQQYLSRHRTRAVDVDSAGRSCKERMLTILFDSAANCTRFNDFRLEEVDSFSSLQTLFENVGLTALFAQTVSQLVTTKKKT